jgi:hypothetical protein
LDSFVSDREDDREFLIHHAIGLDCESIAHTHLIINPVERIKVLGYFTLGSSHMSVFGPRDRMNGRTRIHTDGRTIPIHAIWKICPGEGCPVTSSEMLAYALDTIRSSNMLTGCRFVRSDCRHSDSTLFQDAGFRFIRTDEEGEMDQLLLVM